MYFGAVQAIRRTDISLRPIARRRERLEVVVINSVGLKESQLKSPPQQVPTFAHAEDQADEVLGGVLGVDDAAKRAIEGAHSSVLHSVEFKFL